MNKIKFGSITPQFQPAPENVKQSIRVATDYRRALDGTLVSVGPVKNYRQWSVILPCGRNFGDILSLLSSSFSFTDLEGGRAMVRVVGLGNITEPIVGMGECEILLEETTPWNGALTVDSWGMDPVVPPDPPVPTYVLPETITETTSLIFPLVSNMPGVFAVYDDNITYTAEGDIDRSCFSDEAFVSNNVSERDKSSFFAWLDAVESSPGQYTAIFSIEREMESDFSSSMDADLSAAYREKRFIAGSFSYFTSRGISALEYFKYACIDVWCNGFSG